jgi:CBS domain-containing protein
MAKVEDIISTHINPVTPATPITEVSKQMRTSRQSIIPVCENDKLRGIISEKDIIYKIVASGQNAKKENAGKLMTNGSPKVPFGCDVVEAAKIMANNGINYLPVVQNGGRFVGILTLNDLIQESIVLASMVLATTSQHATSSASGK